MNKRIYSLIFLLALSNLFPLFAKEVSPEMAKRVARNCYYEKSFSQNHYSYEDVVVNDLITNNSEESAYYIVNVNNGFVIVSAEDAVFPILAWSTAGSFVSENQPENYKAWMEGISKQIAYAREIDQKADIKTRDAWQHYLTSNLAELLPDNSERSVNPMITTTWDQGYPYNMQCPADALGSGGHVVVGCVAIAMAQVIYYWRYPLQGTGSHGYNSNYGYLFANYGNTTYDWNAMTNVATPNSDELAKLLAHVGISVEMMYSANSSGAYSDDAANALKNYFNYSNDVTLIYKDNYSETDWANILMSNLDAGHPMYYDGYGAGGGHAFNVDGYQGADYFHFNWGWSGSNNGYYYLNNLNPGGYSFTQGQGAIVNIVPADNYPYYCNGTTTFTNLTGSLEDGSGPTSDYINGAGCNWLIAPDDSVSNLTLRFDRFSTQAGEDILTVYDGADMNAPVLGTFSGNNTPPALTASGSKLYITFRTDNANTDPGWLASYSSLVAEYCQSNNTYTEASGIISDGSGPRNYHNNTFCRYKIVPENAASITLSFQSFNTLGDNDYLSIYDIESQSLLYKLHGSQNPGTLTLNSGKIIMLFKTDDSGTAPGWQINYVSAPNVNIDETKTGASELHVYPNPAGDLLNVNLASRYQGSYNIKLFSSSGSLVYNSQHIFNNAAIMQIDVSRFPEGLYMLQMQGSDSNFLQRIIIK